MDKETAKTGKNGRKKRSLPHVEVWDKLGKDPEKYQGYQFPKVTVAVPSYNSARSIARTLDSILAQQYPNLDVIVVDAGSTDRTLQIVSSYYGEKVRLYSVTNYNLSEMFNKGVALAKGQYISFLCPGFFFLNKDSIQSIMSLAIDHEMPHLVYGAAMLRNRQQQAKILFRPLVLSNLRKGYQPTSLGACWFRKDVFRKLGGFALDIEMKAGLDMICRIVKSGKLEAVSTSRIMVDQELRPITRGSIVQHFHETLVVVYRQFGLWAAIKWLLLYQKDFGRIVKAWWRNLRIAFSGKGG